MLRYCKSDYINVSIFDFSCEQDHEMKYFLDSCSLWHFMFDRLPKKLIELLYIINSFCSSYLTGLKGFARCTAISSLAFHSFFFHNFKHVQCMKFCKRRELSLKYDELVHVFGKHFSNKTCVGV